MTTPLGYGALPVPADRRLALRAAFGERHLVEQPFPWPALARIVGGSTLTLQQRFATALGCTPSAALYPLRLERARELLRDPARASSDIALACDSRARPTSRPRFVTRSGRRRPRRGDASRGEPALVAVRARPRARAKRDAATGRMCSPPG